jgi:hypothetical protein
MSEVTLCQYRHTVIPDYKTAIHSQALRFLELAQRFGGE